MVLLGRSSPAQTHTIGRTLPKVQTRQSSPSMGESHALCLVLKVWLKFGQPWVSGSLSLDSSGVHLEEL